jgi:hypothetical protein
VRVPELRSAGIVNLSGRGMLVMSVARQLGSGNSFDRLLWRPAQAERGRKRRSGSAKLTMPAASIRVPIAVLTRLYPRTLDHGTPDLIENSIRLYGEHGDMLLFQDFPTNVFTRSC